MTAAAKPKRKPGANIHESQRGTVQRKLRLTPDEDAALATVAEGMAPPGERPNVSRAVGTMAIAALKRARRATE